MPTFPTPISFTANTKIKSADANANFTAVATFLNTTKLDSANVQLNGLTRDRLATGAVSTIVVNAASGNMSDAVTDPPNKLPLASQGSDPSTPAAGTVYLYMKNKKPYYINDAGAIAQVGAGSGGGNINYISTSNTQPATNDFESDIQGWCGAAAAATTIAAKTYAVTATMTIASPCVVTATGHGLSSGDPVQFTTSGALPTGLTAGTTYYATVIDANTFNLSATLGGSNINTSGTQSGTHTLRPQRPTTATAGAAPASTFSRTTSSPLRGTASGLITKTAANSCGDAATVDFTIDAADKAKVLSISFDYSASANFVSSSGQAGSDSDVEVWIVDRGNSNARIPVSPAVLTSATNTFKGIFQTASNSTTYTLVLIIPTNNGNAWTMEIENVQVGPQATVYGPALGDWNTLLSPTVNGLGTLASSNIQTKRVGDTLHVTGTVVAGTVAASTASISLPSGLAIDSTKLPPNTNGTSVGTWFQAANNTTVTALYTGSNAQGVFFYDGSDTAKVYFGYREQNGAAQQISKDNGSQIFGNSALVTLDFKVPIAGWSSNSVMSSDTDTRVVALSASGTVSQPGGSTTAIVFPTVNKDTHSAYNASTGIYTAPVAGWYSVSTFFINTNHPGNCYISKNGNANNVALLNKVVTSTDAVAQGNGSAVVYLNAGDAIHVEMDIALTGAGGGQLSIYRLSGPAAIAATESVNARYFASSTSISGSLATVVWTTKDYDSHNEMSSGVYTVPVSGKYKVRAALALSAASAAAGNAVDLQIQKNGSVVSEVSPVYQSTQVALSVAIEDEVNCLAGDQLRVQVSSAATTPAISTSNSKNYISIARIGN